MEASCYSCELYDENCNSNGCIHRPDDGSSLANELGNERCLTDSELAIWLKVRFQAAMYKEDYQSEEFDSSSIIGSKKSTESISSSVVSLGNEIDLDEDMEESMDCFDREDTDHPDHPDHNTDHDVEKEEASEDNASEDNASEDDASEDGSEDSLLTYEILVAKNEVSGVQLRLASNQIFVLSTDTTNWYLPKGHAPRARVALDTSNLPSSLGIELYILGTVQDENDNFHSEHFLPLHFSGKLAKMHTCYLRIRVGDDVPTGIHQVPVKVYTQAAGYYDEDLNWMGVLEINVLPVALPPVRDWEFHLDLWQHLTSIARTHMTNLWSDRHFNLIDAYFSSLKQLGQKSVSIVATETPWAGQQCYLENNYPSALYEHAILQVYCSEMTDLAIDFTHFDRLIELAHYHHMDKEIEVFGLLSNWVDVANGFGGTVQDTPEFWRIRYLDKSTGKMKYLRSSNEIKLFLQYLYEHFETKGLLEKVRICADEPSNLKLFFEQMDFLRQIAPGFKYKIAINHLEFMQFAPPEVVDCVPILPLVCADLNSTNELKQRLHENGGKMLWYICCHPNFPNTFVSSPLVEGQLIGWLTYFLKLDGFLRWNFCLWPTHPWHNLKWRTSSWRVGDMFFVLPGLDGNPVESLRYEAIRFAVQDNQLLRMAEKLLDDQTAKELFQHVSNLIFRTDDLSNFANAGKHDISPTELYSLDPYDYQAARQAILKAVAFRS